MMSVCLLIAFYAAGPPLATPERPILLQKISKKKRSHFRETRTRQLQGNTKLSVRELCNAAAGWLEIILNVLRDPVALCVRWNSERACGSACVIFASHYALILMRDKLDFN
jgi:hypothetical protein